MILVFRYVPSDSPETPNQWVWDRTMPDDKSLDVLPDGEYAIYQPTKAEIDAPDEVVNPLAKSFQFDRRVKIKTPEVKAKVATV